MERHDKPVEVYRVSPWLEVAGRYDPVRDFDTFDRAIAHKKALLASGYKDVDIWHLEIQPIFSTEAGQS